MSAVSIVPGRIERAVWVSCVGAGPISVEVFSDFMVFVEEQCSDRRQ
jgi:hypothetical protein